MLGGAVAVLILGQIAPAAALAAINIDVMVFLFGMFVVGEALSRSGYSTGSHPGSSGTLIPRASSLLL